MTAATTGRHGGRGTAARAWGRAIRRAAGAALLSLAAVTGAARAQAPAPADQAAREEALAVVRKLFEGMKTRDTALLASVFTPDARLVTAMRDRAGEFVVRATAASEFVHIVGTATGDAWDERIRDPEVRVDGPLVQVWAPYEFWLGTKFSHCGVDAIHLARVGTAWKIIHLSDTQRRDGCTLH